MTSGSMVSITATLWVTVVLLALVPAVLAAEVAWRWSQRCRRNFRERE